MKATASSAAGGSIERTLRSHEMGSGVFFRGQTSVVYKCGRNGRKKRLPTPSHTELTMARHLVTTLLLAAALSVGAESTLAQQLPDVARRIAFEDAPVLLALRVDGNVLIRSHQSLRVTLSTSSSVVTPAKIFCTPSSRMLGVSVRA